MRRNAFFIIQRCFVAVADELLTHFFLSDVRLTGFDLADFNSFLSSYRLYSLFPADYGVRDGVFMGLV